MKINKKEIFLTYTNALFLVPLIIGLKNEEWRIAIILGIFTASSTLYHLFRKPGAEWWWYTKGRTGVQTFMLILEITLALALSAWSIITLYEKSSILFGIAVILFIPGFVTFLSTNYKRYLFYHTVWHIVAAVIITFALI